MTTHHTTSTRGALLYNKNERLTAQAIVLNQVTGSLIFPHSFIHMDSLPTPAEHPLVSSGRLYFCNRPFLFTICVP